MRTILALCLSCLVLGEWLPLGAQVVARRPARLGVVAYEDERQGVVVEQVRPGGPGQEAGLQAGDRIVKIGDLPIASDSDLLRALEGIRPGYTTTVVVVREGKQTSLTVTFPPDVPREREGSLESAEAALERAVRSLEPSRGAPGVDKALAEIATARQQIAAIKGAARVKKPLLEIDLAILARIQALIAAGTTPERLKVILAEEFPGAQVIQNGAAGGEGDGRKPLPQVAPGSPGKKSDADPKSGK